MTVFAASGCQLAESINYSRFDVPINLTFIGDTLTCIQDTAQLCIVNPHMSIEWTFDNTVISTDSCVVVDQPGDYLVNVLNLEGCTGSGTYNLVSVSLPDIDIENLPDSISISCQDSAAILAPTIQGDTTGLNLSWSISNTLLSNEQQITIDSVGVYLFEIRDPNSGCFIVESVVVSRIESSLDLNSIFIIADTIQCDADSALVLINGIDLEDIELFINQELIENTMNIMLAEGEYDFTLIDSLGCDITIMQSIVTVDEFTLDIGPDIIVDIGQQVTIPVLLSIPLSETIEFEWSDSDVLDCITCLDPNITVTEDITLSLSVTDINGCMRSDSLLISVIEISDFPNIYAPTVFSPNATGVNNEWQLYLEGGNTKLLEMRIYDRWGNLVIFRSNFGEFEEVTWDGTFDGQDAEQGVYVFVVKYLDNTNIERLVHGQITLIR